MLIENLLDLFLDERNYSHKSVKLPHMLPANYQSPVRADDVLTIITNSNTGNQYDNRPRHKSHGQKSKDKWVPSYV